PPRFEESVPRARIDVRLERLAHRRHLPLHFGQARVDARIIFAVDPENWGLDPGERGAVGRGTVADDGRLEARVVRRVPEALPTAPAEPDGADVSLAHRRQTVHVRIDRVEVRGDGRRVQLAHELPARIR